MKLEREDLLRAAREADARAREAEATGTVSTRRPPAVSAVSTAEHSHVDAQVDALLGTPGAADRDPDHPTDSSELTRASAAPDRPDPGSVPSLVVAREDVAWFGLDPTSERIVEAIDGRSTVEQLIARLELDGGPALDVLGELAARGLVEFFFPQEPGEP